MLHAEKLQIQKLYFLLLITGNNHNNSKFSWVILTEKYTTDMNWIKYAKYGNEKEITKNCNLKRSNLITQCWHKHLGVFRQYAGVEGNPQSQTDEPCTCWLFCICSKSSMPTQSVREKEPLFHENVGNCFWHIGCGMDNISHVKWEMIYCLARLVIPALATAAFSCWDWADVLNRWPQFIGTDPINFPP